MCCMPNVEAAMLKLPCFLARLHVLVCGVLWCGRYCPRCRAQFESNRGGKRGTCRKGWGVGGASILLLPCPSASHTNEVLRSQSHVVAWVVVTNEVLHCRSRVVAWVVVTAVDGVVQRKKPGPQTGSRKGVVSKYVGSCLSLMSIAEQEDVLTPIAAVA